MEEQAGKMVLALSVTLIIVLLVFRVNVVHWLLCVVLLHSPLLNVVYNNNIKVMKIIITSYIHNMWSEAIVGLPWHAQDTRHLELFINKLRDFE